MDDQSDLVEVYAPATSAQAFVLRNLLVSEGIQAEVTGAATADLWAAVTPLASPQIVVRPADEARARQLIAQWEEQEKVHGGDPTVEPGQLSIDFACHQCGQQVSYPVEMQGSVQECPHCGAYVDVPSTTGELPEAGEAPL